MLINGGDLANQELYFANQPGITTANVVFASDDAAYGTNGIPSIWAINGQNTTPKTPVLRIEIDPNGNTRLLGRRNVTSALEPLKLIGGASLNQISWNVNTTNRVIVSQLVTGPTVMEGIGYGKEAVACACVKPAASGISSVRTNVGVSTKANVTSGWPEVVPNGYIALESSNAGLVIPHMTTTQRDALTAIEGMLIYNTTENCVQLYRGESPLIDPSRKGWNCLERGCNE